MKIDVIKNIGWDDTVKWEMHLMDNQRGKTCVPITEDFALEIMSRLPFQHTGAEATACGTCYYWTWTA